MKKIRRERRVAAIRSGLAGVLAVWAAIMLLRAIATGQFDDVRTLGTIAFHEHPVGFIFMALGTLGAACLLATLSVIFGRQSRA